VRWVVCVLCDAKDEHLRPNSGRGHQLGRRAYIVHKIPNAKANCRFALCLLHFPILHQPTAWLCELVREREEFMQNKWPIPEYREREKESAELLLGPCPATDVA